MKISKHVLLLGIFSFLISGCTDAGSANALKPEPVEYLDADFSNLKADEKVIVDRFSSQLVAYNLKTGGVRTLDPDLKYFGYFDANYHGNYFTHGDSDAHEFSLFEAGGDAPRRILEVEGSLLFPVSSSSKKHYFLQQPLGAENAQEATNLVRLVDGKKLETLYEFPYAISGAVVHDKHLTFTRYSSEIGEFELYTASLDGAEIKKLDEEFINGALFLLNDDIITDYDFGATFPADMCKLGCDIDEKERRIYWTSVLNNKVIVHVTSTETGETTTHRYPDVVGYEPTEEGMHLYTAQGIVELSEKDFYK
ncbi:hypothetical protein [Timonella sp. A28]|uniref:hypothetical protein n=1 Tax=Timonella sp. A28 TaxID=3442640 RepID=UPI003EB847EA